MEKIKLRSIKQSIIPEKRKKRKIIYHYGPTNSGKTYAALDRLMKSKSGIYCGPLRFLANEIYYKLLANNVPCSLLTGVEKIVNTQASIYSCTSEYSKNLLSIEFECAVIDEIQMISDVERGSAWTQVFLGLKADEIHLCGDPSAFKIIENICNELGDDLQLQKYERISQLSVVDQQYDIENHLTEGDCFVVFQIDKIFQISKIINKIANEKYNTENINYCSIVYGRQSYEIKSIQTQLFNTQKNKFLIATDAIGMGINLNIKRIIFVDISKNLNGQFSKIQMQQIVQIAGRAGRYKQDGYVYSLYKSNLNFIKQALNNSEKFNEISNYKQNKAALEIYLEQIIFEIKPILDELYPHKQLSLVEIYKKVQALIGEDDNYFYLTNEQFIFNAQMIEKYNLHIEDQYRFSRIPTRKGNQYQTEQQMICVYASQFKETGKCYLPELFKNFEKINELFNQDKEEKELQDVIKFFDVLNNIIEGYKYLGNIYGSNVFVDLNIVDPLKSLICEIQKNIYQKNLK